MFRYDPNTKILKIQKVNEMDLQLNLEEFQLESYNKYIHETIYSDIDVLVKEMLENLNVSDVKADVIVDGPHIVGIPQDTYKTNPSHYSVKVKFSIDGIESGNFIEILRIPTMNDDGVLNVKGEPRVVPMQLVAAERISYDNEKQSMSITLPKRNISISLGQVKDVVVKYGSNQNVPMHKLVRMYNQKEKVCLDPSKFFLSALAALAFGSSEDMSDETISDELDKAKIYENYTGENYSLGDTRDALNEALSLDRAIGRILSRKIGSYDPGYIIDEDVLMYARKNCINEIYVKDEPSIAGTKLKEKLIISEIPMGTRNNDRLREELPEYSKLESIPEDTISHIEITPKEILSIEDVQLMYDTGLEQIECVGAGGRVFTAYFEEEIIGNYTTKLGSIWSKNIPDDRSYDEWVYYYNNPNYERRDTDHLNAHDIMALYSLCLYIKSNPDKNYLLDKDFNLLKKVRSVNEIFSSTIQASIKTFVIKYRYQLNKAIKETSLREDKFYGLTDAWITNMWRSKSIVIADTVNPIATISQTNHLLSGLNAKKVPEKMRLLSMHYYGRVCPYETPESKKLGTTNTRAVGAKILNGILLTPYRKVLKNSTGAIVGISDNLSYMDAQEEANYRIGDILSLEMLDDKYVNNKVMARIPADKHQVTVENVDAYTLDYVNAYCEQHMSPTAALIPFASADDAVRVTLACKMIKQSLLVQGNQIPRTMTSMYRHMFDQSNTYVIRAKKDGVVDAIPVGSIVVLYDGEDEPERIDIKETAILNNTVNFLNFHVKEGSRFKKGDILVDSAISKEGIYSPGVNMFVAYIADGYNYEDAIEPSEYAATLLTSITSEKVKTAVNKRYNESARVGREYYYRYIPENGVIAKISRTSNNDTRRQSTSYMRSKLKSGILYQILRDKKETKSAVFNAYLLSFKKTGVGDKLAGRHSNKGTVSRVQSNSKMPCFMNGRQVDLMLNPCGVPSRMNIGQNYEGFLGFVATLLDVYIESNAFNGATRGDIKLLLRYVYDLANNDNASAVCARYPMLPKELHEQAKRRHPDIRLWEGCFEPDGTAKLWNPESGKCFYNNATIGVAYFLKLEHMVDLKEHARGGVLEEDYSQISMQPTEGSMAGGGQKQGEWEFGVLAAYGASQLLYETQNALSDNVQQRIEDALKTLGREVPTGAFSSLPYSVEMFRYYLEVLGYKLEDSEGMFDESAEGREVPDIRGILTNRTHVNIDKENETYKLLKAAFTGGGAV